MIAAAGLTPAWQQIVELDDFQLGGVLRARAVHWLASGKVTNVAAALGRLGARTRLVSVAGGATGTMLAEDIARRGIDARWTLCAAATRACTTLIDHRSGSTTELVENARPLAASDLENFRAAFMEAARESDVVVFSGSLPQSTPADFPARLLAETNARLILDLRGNELLHALSLAPLIVKPNRSELAATTQKPITNEPELRSAARELIQKGAQWVIVTAGADAVYAFSAERAARLRPIAMPVQNPIGCGDCLAGGLAFGLDQGLEVLDALTLGMAAAAQNVASLLPADIDLGTVRRLATQIVSEAIES